MKSEILFCVFEFISPVGLKAKLFHKIYYKIFSFKNTDIWIQPKFNSFLVRQKNKMSLLILKISQTEYI